MEPFDGEVSKTSRIEGTNRQLSDGRERWFIWALHQQSSGLNDTDGSQDRKWPRIIWRL